MTKVSVIVPNFNHAEFLQQRLDSIFNQTYHDFEVILLDDASTDNSVEILNSYKNHLKVSHFLINDNNSGSSFRQWKKGIELAKGTYIWIAESDDFCDSMFLEKMVVELDKGAQICYSQSSDVNAEGSVISNRIEYTSEFDQNIWENNFTLNGKEFIKNYLSAKNVIPNASAVAFSKNVVSDSFFDEQLLQMYHCGDWLFWIKACEKSKVAFIDESLNYFRIHKGATRMHTNINRKKSRLLEEVICRNYLAKTYSFSNAKKNNKLVRNWVDLHSKWALLRKDFYQFNLFNCSGICLLLKFIKVKLQTLC